MSRRAYLIIALVVLALVSGAFAAYSITPLRKSIIAIPALQRAYAFVHFRGPQPNDLAWLGDGRAAGEVLLHDPSGLAVDASGNVFVADRGRWWGLQVIWRIDPGGGARAIAGTARRGSTLAGEDARRADLGQPEGLSVDAENRIYFADAFNYVVLRVDPDGRLTRVVGTGTPGYSGDGGPAVSARLSRPYDVDLDSTGNLYIADFDNHRIRMVSADGLIRTVAGTGEPGYDGDGGPATAARLNGPYGLTVDKQDRLLIADSLNNVVRRVDHNGIITTIAGTGEMGYAGDGGPALQARLDTPQALVVDDAGFIYVGDEHNHAVRRIAPDGTIQAVLGDGTPGLSPDGTPAAQSRLNDPESLVVLPDRTLLVTEGDNGLVRTLDTQGQLETFAGRQ